MRVSRMDRTAVKSREMILRDFTPDSIYDANDGWACRPARIAGNWVGAAAIGVREGARTLSATDLVGQL